MDRQFKVLVTGSTGFIGSHLIPKLANEGYQVFGLERYVTGRYVLGESRKFKTVFSDLRESFSVKKILHEIRPDFVIHLASISPVSYSYDHPQEVIEANFIGTVNLVEACLHEVPNLKQFLFASTSETYGKGPNPKKEETIQNPNSPYAVGKVACEKYLSYMVDAYDFPITILRNFNTYGRKNNAHFVVERSIVQMLTKKTVKLGDPNPIRDMLYVDDHVTSYLNCLNNLKAKGEIFNFCTGIGTSIGNVINLISLLTDFKGEVFWDTIPPKPLEVKEIIGDFSKAKHLLNWEPKISLEKGLAWTIEYWKKKLNSFR